MALAISSAALSSLPSREIHQKVFHERKATCLPRRTLTNATKGVPSICDPLPPDKPLWFPSSSPPEWLDGIPLQISISCRLVSHRCGCDGRDHKANLFRHSCI